MSLIDKLKVLREKGDSQKRRLREQSAIGAALAKHGYENAPGTIEVKEIRNEPGIPSGRYVFWNGAPLEKID